MVLNSQTGMALVTSKAAVSYRNSFSASKPIAIKSSHGVQSPPLDSDLIYSLSGLFNDCNKF